MPQSNTPQFDTTSFFNSKVGVAIVIAIAVITFVFIFKESLKELIKQIKHLRIPGIIELDMEALQEVQKQIVDTGIASPPGNIDDIADTDLKGADLSARDAVLENWGSLKQIVDDAASSRKIQLTPGIELSGVLDLLVNANLITKQLANSIKVLYEAGEKIVENPGKRLDRKYARVYGWLADKLIAWIRRNIIAPPPEPKKPPPPPPPPPRRTQVGGYFPTPGVGAAAMILVGIKGPVHGKQFRVEKELFRIGADPANDLVLANDDYVSAKHALIRYDKGSLVLADQHSRNGTFINDNRLKDTALTLTPGDRIRIGGSTFEVVQAPGR